MELVYLGIVIFLFALSTFDLFVGVSNDAVNFLGSAIGSKVARFKTILIIAAVMTVVYFFIDPTASPLFPKCPFWYVTNIKCPGCGSQRAIHDLLHLDITAACSHNLLMTLSIPYLLLLIYSQQNQKRHPRLYKTLYGRIAIYAALIIIVIWTVLRNLFNI